MSATHTNQQNAESDDESTPMLMIHASHFAVGWRDGEPSIDSTIPADASTIDGTGAFVKLEDAVYKRGGKVFRATFRWSKEHTGNKVAAGSQEQTAQKDVMLCGAGMCHVCDTSVAETSAAAGDEGMPFVHSSCVEYGARQGAHTFDVFQPRAGLKQDLARPYPPTKQEQIVVDGELRDVWVCVPEQCTFCSEVGAGRKPSAPVLTKTEKRMATFRKAFRPYK